MLDHPLVSRPLLRFFRAVEIHDEALGDGRGGGVAGGATARPH